jgi:hypothetical protein
MNELRKLLFEAIRELSYIRCVELPGDHSQCATSLGEDIIKRGIKLLGVSDLSDETFAQFEAGD